MPKRIENRGPNTYRLNVSGGMGPDGKQIVHRKTITAKDDSAAEREYGKFQAEIEAGKVATGKKMTLAEFFNYWLEHTDHEAATVEYNKQLFVRIKDMIGHLRIDKIQPRHLLEFLKLMGEETCKPQEKKIPDEKPAPPRPLSPNTIRKHFVLVKTLLNKARQWQMIAGNPAEHVEPPKGQRSLKSVQDMDVTATFLECMEKESIKHQMICLLAFSGGLRREEIYGLEWSDVNWDDNSIHVQRASIYVRGSGIIEKDTKTIESDRKISLPPQVMGLLKQHKAQQAALQLKQGDNWIKSNRVLTKSDGSPAHPHGFNTWIKRFCTRHKLPNISPHDFRHMTATYLIESGVDVTTVSGKLGHNQRSTTDLYSHLLKSAEKKTADVMGEILKKRPEIKKEKI